MSQDMRSAVRQVPADVPKRSGLDENTQTTLLSTGGVLGAVGLSSCCILPLALFSVGVTGTWIGNLAALYPYKWYFFVPAAAFIAAGFYRVYRKPKVIGCEESGQCGTPVSNRINKIALWFATVLALAALIFPYVVPYLLET